MFAKIHSIDQLPSIQTLFAEAGSVFGNAFTLIAIVFIPLVVFALIVHWLEITMQRRLAERFGWKSVLWTGWLGTPIHELSHALMCVIFRHKIVDIALFEPDQESGRLGYVRHASVRGNWFQELGNVFIGIAPLIGGSIALTILLWLFYPDAAAATLPDQDPTAGLVGQTYAIIVAVCSEILAPSNFLTLRFWAFMYLVLCVGAHMAPSGSDYEGAAGRGLVLFVAIVVGMALLLTFLQSDIQQLTTSVIAVLGPMVAVLVLTVILCSIATLVVYGLTSFIPQSYRVR